MSLTKTLSIKQNILKRDISAIFLFICVYLCIYIDKKGYSEFSFYTNHRHSKVQAGLN